MENRISILHISDIHRNQEGKIDNQALIASLIQDKNRYTSMDDIAAPDLIIVSGDIIYGSVNPDYNVAIQEINSQYTEAELFLNELVEEFLNGDKKRIVIVPGNHDVSHPHVISSLKELDVDKIENKSLFAKQQNKEHGKIRWSWEKLKFYEITDQTIYKNRFQPFKHFYDRFYNGIQTFSLDADDQYNIFDCGNLGLTIVAYNSCYNNDLLNPMGSISPNCIAKSYREIQKYIKEGRFVVGTWHHNVKGAPQESNYMDTRIIKNILSSGITLGFHGHQHLFDKIDEYMNVSEREKISLISAGTLCAGASQLPLGVNRQYNILEIYPESYKAKLHSRKMMGNIASNFPIWEKEIISGCEKGYIELQFQKPIKPKTDFILSEAINYMGKKDYISAIKILNPLSAKNMEARRFLVECYIQTQNNKELISLICIPNNETEAIILLKILFQEREREELKKALLLDLIAKSSNRTINELKNQCKAIL